MSQAVDFATLTAACREVPPLAAVVLGSGMGPVAARLKPLLSVPFAQVPGLPSSSVVGHKGKLTLGDWAGRRVLLFEGRLHFYEGHPWAVVTRPMAVAAELGARVALLTNAAGGIRDDLTPGSLMALTDHLEWNRAYWWRHPGPGGLGPSRPSPYSARLREVLSRAAAVARVELAHGAYASVTGPSYETPAEIRALRAWGADAVGMSTTREAHAASAAGMECAAVSCITNRAAGLTGEALNHEEVLATAAAQAERLTALLEGVLAAVA